MSNTHVTRAFDDLKRRLADAQSKLLEGKAWMALRASESWDIVEGWITAQIAARQAEFMSERELTHVQTEVMRAEVRMLARLLQSGKTTPEQIQRWETQVATLQQEIAKRQNTALDRDFSLTTTRGTT